MDMHKKKKKKKKKKNIKKQKTTKTKKHSENAYISTYVAVTNILMPMPEHLHWTLKS